MRTSPALPGRADRWGRQRDPAGAEQFDALDAEAIHIDGCSLHRPERRLSTLFGAVMAVLWPNHINPAVPDALAAGISDPNVTKAARRQSAR